MPPKHLPSWMFYALAFLIIIHEIYYHIIWYVNCLHFEMISTSLFLLSINTCISISYDFYVAQTIRDDTLNLTNVN